MVPKQNRKWFFRFLDMVGTQNQTQSRPTSAKNIGSVANALQLERQNRRGNSHFLHFQMPRPGKTIEAGSEV